MTLVILSTGIVLVLQAFETSAAALSAARDATRATMLARGKLAEIEFEFKNNKAANLGPAESVFGGDYQAYNFRRDISGGSGKGGDAAVVTITVWRKNSEATYAISTMLRQ